MGLNRVWATVVMLMLLKGWWSSNGCLDQDKIALLQLKPFFNSRVSLLDWVDDQKSLDCCQWERVECNTSTGRVTHLYLNFTRDWGSENQLYLNASLFLPFEKLQVLSLYENNITGWVENEGFETLPSRLTNLEVLDLSFNSFNDSIFSFLSGFSSLKSLYLTDNNFGLIQKNGFETLPSRLTNLEVLDLSFNSFNDSIFSSLSWFSSLKTLYLAGNNFTGLIQKNGFETLPSRLTNLEVFDLSVNSFNDSIYSSLSRFSSLKSLYLAHNDFTGLIQKNGVERLQRLINLEVLDLSANHFNNSILSFLGRLSSLKSLNIGYNRLKGSIQIKDALCNLEKLGINGNEVEKFVVSKDNRCMSRLKALYLYNVNTNKSILLQSLGPLPSLKTLDLGGNDFSGTMTTLELHNLTNVEELFLDNSYLQINFLQSLGALTSLKNLYLWNGEINGTLSAQDSINFKNLEHLDMTSTSVDNSFLQSIGEMNSLKVLWLYNCGLSGTLPAQGFCKLIHLQELYINNNDLGGSLPECLANLTSLQSLDLSGNQFTGNIAMSSLKSLTSIQYLSLSDNHFQIPISLAPFFNHSKLERFHGDKNEIYAEKESHSLAPKFQLNSISLSGYGYGGALPKFLYHQHDLQKVDLSHIHFRGEFPNWLLENNTGLDALSLVNNSLSGLFQVPSFPHMNLSSLDISNNFFYGQILADVGAYLPRLSYLNMSTNAFNGSIPSSLGDINFLNVLDLSNNHLFGKIPENLAAGCFSLQYLALSNNNLHGQIFSANFNLKRLSQLQLDGNQFTGRIPDSLSNCSGLEVLDISKNRLSGRIPRWIGNLSILEEFTMTTNQLEGPIPMEFCQLDLLILDLSENNISGSLPSCFRPSRIIEVRLSKNMLQGPLNEAFNSSSSLVTLDLRYNQLTGGIPNWIGRLSQLSFLLLSYNNLEGEIPFQLCHLDQLSLIDLSHNNFSGRIPPCLNITTLEEVSSAPRFYSEAPPSANSSAQGPIEFTTKSMSYSYEGRILTYMSGFDLSCNKLTGEIPQEIGNLSKIRVLNLSYNSLTGPIPPTFSNLREIESLDLSNNNLSGKIPHELVELYALAVFSVAHNNLSGKIPETAQFATFEKSSYEANPLLCGTPLPKSCDATGSPSPMPRASTKDGEDSGFVDMSIFYVSFTVTYLIVLLGIAAVLYINPYWRRVWFYHIEMWITSCFYFVEDNLPKRFCHGNM